MGFVARHVLVMRSEAKCATFSMRSIDPFMSNSNTFMTIHYVFPITTSFTYFYLLHKEIVMIYISINRR
jgi:hypothetical protein